MNHNLWFVYIQRYKSIQMLTSKYFFQKIGFRNWIELEVETFEKWGNKDHLGIILWSLTVYTYIPGLTVRLGLHIQIVKRNVKSKLSFSTTKLPLTSTIWWCFFLYFVFWHLSIFRINLNRIRIHYLVTWDFEIRVLEETFLCGHSMTHLDDSYCT